MFVCSAAGSRGLLRVNLPPPPPHFGLFSFFFLYSSLFPSFSLWLCLLLLTTSNRSAISVSTPANFFPSSRSQSQKLPLTTCPVGRPSTSPTIGGGKKKEKKENSSALKSSPFFVISPASNYCVALTSVGNRSGRHCATISQSEVIRPAPNEDG